MAEQINIALPFLVLASHILLAVLFLATLARHSWGRKITHYLGKHALPFAFIVSIAAISGSLFYSEVIGYEPCILCWWQRVFLYPQVFIYGIALWKKNKSAFLYGAPLAGLSAIIAAYHSYVYMGGKSLLACTALGGACSKVYVFAFGYVSIPLMSLTISLYLLLLAREYRIYDKNSNAR